MLPLKLRENLYRAFIALHFNYCAKSWHFCHNCLTEKLEKLNEQALGFVYQDEFSTYETQVVTVRSTKLLANSFQSLFEIPKVRYKLSNFIT